MKRFFMRLSSLAGIVALGYGGGYLIAELQEPSPKRTDMSCMSDFDVYTASIHFKGNFQLLADGGKGVLQIKGGFSRPNSEPAIVNRKIFFDYINYGEMLDMTSREIDISAMDNAKFDELSTLFPLFFHIPNVMYNLGFYHQNNGYILTGAVIPFIYCQQV